MTNEMDVGAEDFLAACQALSVARLPETTHGRELWVVVIGPAGAARIELAELVASGIKVHGVLVEDETSVECLRAAGPLVAGWLTALPAEMRSVVLQARTRGADVLLVADPHRGDLALALRAAGRYFELGRRVMAVAH